VETPMTATTVLSAEQPCTATLVEQLLADPPCTLASVLDLAPGPLPSAGPRVKAGR